MDNTTAATQVRHAGEQRALNPDDPLVIHGSDHPGMQLVSVPLNGRNFLTWSRSMRLALCAKVKLGFIDGRYKKPSETDVDYDRWKRADSMVTSWLLNSISKEIVNCFMYSESARELWKELEERYGECNGPQLYQIQREISSISQGGTSIADYYSWLKQLWDELSCLSPQPGCACGVS